jgi:hypothetical protein
VADNVPITAGTGTDIATDEVTTTGEHIQLFKLAVSADGSRVLVPADASNGMLVDVSRVQGQVQIGDGTNAVSVDTSGADAETNAISQLHTQARLYGFNGTTWDRIRSSVSTWKTHQATTALTGFSLWQPSTVDKSLVITSVQIQSGGTNSGTCILWFGDSADNTYTRGTDPAIFDGEFVPSATNKPGVIMSFPTPIRGPVGEYLRITTTGAQTVTITVWGYEI